MNVNLSLVSAIIIVAFLLFGAGITLIGMLGLLRFKSFYERLHMVSMATSWGIGGIIIASLLYSWLVEGKLVFHELILSAFMIVTTPVTLMLLSRAAMNRDYSEDWRNIPASLLVRRPKAESNNTSTQQRPLTGVLEMEHLDKDKGDWSA